MRGAWNGCPGCGRYRGHAFWCRLRLRALAFLALSAILSGCVVQLPAPESRRPPLVAPGKAGSVVTLRIRPHAADFWLVVPCRVSWSDDGRAVTYFPTDSRIAWPDVVEVVPLD